MSLRNLKVMLRSLRDEESKEKPEGALRNLKVKKKSEEKDKPDGEEGN